MTKDCFSIHDEDKLKKLLEENGEPAFRYAQIENAIYKNFISNFEDISTISKKAKELLKNNCFYTSLSVKSAKTSKDGQTTKIAFSTSDGKYIEAVIMRHLWGRNTLCISCQVGCPMWCMFCETGKMGLKRNLDFYEIIDEILYAAAILDKEWKILRNIVFMWMWEPFLNYSNVKKAIQIICKKNKLDFSNRRVTVSTCGILDWIKQFWDDFSQTSLAISLHAPNDELRKKIMPVSKGYTIKELMKVLDEYSSKTNKKIFYEYIMISWLNDGIELAHELWKLLKNKLAHVNFIPYNACHNASIKPSSKSKILEFQKILEEYSVTSTLRHTMWDDIDAACWQLAGKE